MDTSDTTDFMLEPLEQRLELNIFKWIWNRVIRPTVEGFLGALGGLLGRKLFGPDGGSPLGGALEKLRGAW